MEGFHQVYSQANGTALAQKDNQHSNYTLLHELKDFDPSPKAKLPPTPPTRPVWRHVGLMVGALHLELSPLCCGLGQDT